MYHYDYGIINYALGVIGIEPVKWMENPRMALAALIIYGDVYKRQLHGSDRGTTGGQHTSGRLPRSCTSSGADIEYV